MAHRIAAPNSLAAHATLTHVCSTVSLHARAVGTAHPRRVGPGSGTPVCTQPTVLMYFCTARQHTRLVRNTQQKEGRGSCADAVMINRSITPRPMPAGRRPPRFPLARSCSNTATHAETMVYAAMRCDACARTLPDAAPMSPGVRPAPPIHGVCPKWAPACWGRLALRTNERGEQRGHWVRVGG